MKRILVGVDGSPTAARALTWTTGLASALDAEIIAANAFSPGDVERRPDHVEELRREREHELDTRWLEPATSAGVAVHGLVVVGEPGPTLLDLARSEDAGLQVVGTRGLGGFLGLRLGSVTEFLAHRAERPLAVVPPEVSEPADITTVVLGLDGSEGSAAAARWTAEWAGALGARVVAVHAIRRWADYLPGTDPHRIASHVRSLLEIWTAPLEDAGVDVVTRLVEDEHPVAAMIGVSDEVDADLIVVGARGIGGFLGMRLGGVTLQTLHHSPRPVVVIPPTS